MLLLATFVFSGCVNQAEVKDGSHVEAAELKENVNGDLKISMLRIGQGDAILIQTGKQTILIDTALANKNELLVKGLEKFSVTRIDKLIITHPHADHIGGARMLLAPKQEELALYPYLEKISVGEVYDNGIAHTSGLYKNYLKALKKKGITHHSLKTGDVLDFGNGVKFDVLFPTEEFVTTVNTTTFDKEDREHNINNGSLVGKLTYKKFSMMFTGDCEKESEAKILASNAAKDLKCDVLKSAHHGNKTSSTEDFVAAVNPSVILISASNRMKDGVLVGQPHLKVIKTYLAAGVAQKNMFCTRFNGIITVTSDGKNFSVTPEIEEDWVDKWTAHLTKKK